jgi:hypothetical protein
MSRAAYRIRYCYGYEVECDTPAEAVALVLAMTKARPVLPQLTPPREIVLELDSRVVPSLPDPETAP